MPKSYTDRSLSSKIKDLKIDEVQTITVIPQKYLFPRVRNLPNKVLCEDETGKLDCIFFAVGSDPVNATPCKEFDLDNTSP